MRSVGEAVPVGEPAASKAFSPVERHPVAVEMCRRKRRSANEATAEKKTRHRLSPPFQACGWLSFDDKDHDPRPFDRLRSRWFELPLGRLKRTMRLRHASEARDISCSGYACSL